jgi:hypothetical protein
MAAALSPAPDTKPRETPTANGDRLPDCRFVFEDMASAALKETRRRSHERANGDLIV